jgi:GDPmannose 4,6-dehydratase
MLNQSVVIRSDSTAHPEGLKPISREIPPLPIKDYILASGETHSIREFCEESFRAAGIDNLVWTWTEPDHNPLSQVGISTDYPKQILVKVNPKYYRPADVFSLLGDSTAAREELGWKPKVSFQELVRRMVENDLKISKNTVKYNSG